MVEFAKLGLKKDILEVLELQGFKETMDVQEQIIPLALKGKNIVFTSKTGSGKTLAYTIGYLSKLNKKLGVQMIVLVPTRELGIQVGTEIEKLCTPLGLKVGILYGGRDISGDYRTIDKKNQVIVATPGRLIDHINAKNLKVGETKLLVFDESDQMFDNGFEDHCAYIKSRVSADAQIILASATINKKVHDFIEEEINDYELLEIGSQIPANISQEKIYCSRQEKNELLDKILKEKDFKRAMVFCNTKIKTSHIAEFLESKKHSAKSISSYLDQKTREQRLQMFRKNKLKILVATDVAARGLHIEKVDLVINYDVPRAEYYIHRIGRTGRVEKKGCAVSLIEPADKDKFSTIEEKYSLEVKEI
jgi:ATP-dependent RNA helicase DeaD